MYLAIFGVLGSGKTTLGRHLAQHHGFTEINFADAFKRVCQQIFGFSTEDLYGPSSLRDRQYRDFRYTGLCPTCWTQCRYVPELCTLEEFTSATALPWECATCGERLPEYVTPRVALKTMGSGWGRRICLDLWTTCAVQQATALHWSGQRVALCDGRFLREFESCHAAGASTLLLTRGLATSTSAHESEVQVRELAKEPHRFTYVLDNAAMSVEESLAAIDRMLFTPSCA